jgi:hypothetical protein
MDCDLFLSEKKSGRQKNKPFRAFDTGIAANFSGKSIQTMGGLEGGQEVRKKGCVAG